MWTRLTAAAALMLAAGTAGAATIATEEQVLEMSGEDLVFALSGLPLAAGGGTVTVFTGASAKNPGLDLSGDSADGQGSKFFELTFDGLSQGLFSCGGDAGVGATPIAGGTPSPTLSDCRFSLEVAVDAAALAALLADGLLSVGVLFSAQVTAYNTEADVVGVSLDYDPVAPVPLPAALPLLALALGGLGLARRARPARRVG